MKDLVQDAQSLTQLPPFFGSIMKIERTIQIPESKTLDVQKQEQLQKLQDASRMFERQFLQEMVKAMRGTVQKSGLVPETMGERIFSEQLDHEYIRAWVDSGGVGFADHIYKNIKDRYFPDEK